MSTHVLGLIEAVQTNNVDTVKTLLEKTSPDTRLPWEPKQTVLMGAAKRGYFEICSLLLAKGANVNAVDDSGMTALTLAVSTRRINVTRLLLYNGANVNAMNNDGLSSYFFSIMNRDQNMVLLLEFHGAQEDPRVREMLNEMEADTLLFGDLKEREFVRNIHVLSAISPTVLKLIFGWTIEDQRQGELMESNLDYSDIKESDDLKLWHHRKIFMSLAHNMYSRIHVHAVMEVHTNNPFANWTRPHESSRKFTHKHSGKRKRWPKGKTMAIGETPGKDIAYIVSNYGMKSGTFGAVYPFVVYNNKTCVIKIMEESPDNSLEDAEIIEYVNTKDVFELVTQVYLHEALNELRQHWSSHVKVPEIMFVQTVGNSKALHVCMERADGTFMADISDANNLCTAIAHVMKALWHLQKNYHFMHRDFHSNNVAYDTKAHNVHIIDFGMACINPTHATTRHAWQAYTQESGWYPPLANSKAASCTNRSLDACMLLASLDDSRISEDFESINAFLTSEKALMRQCLTRIVRTDLARKQREHGGDESDEEFAPSTQFTDFGGFEREDWSVGNKGKKTSFYYLYELIEYPCEEFYPENVLRRMLTIIPRDEWPYIRRGWAAEFDRITIDVLADEDL